MKKFNSFYLVIIFASITLLISCSKKEEQKIKKPNILFAIMDDVTYKHMGAYGCDWVKTPNFDRIAKEGILFNRTYTPNAKCGPSRSCILTGRNSWQLEQGASHWAHWPLKFKSFAETLSENNYNVGYTAKGWAPGKAKNADGSNRDLLVNAYNKIKTTPPTSGMANIDYAANFDMFLKERDTLKPFFFWYGGLEPHRGYEYGSGIKKGGKKISDVADDDVFDFWPKVDSVKTDLLDYAFEIEYFDKQLGKMIKSLEDKGELNNTMIVVTSDNGMPFPRVKGQEFEYSNHLPLAIMWPDGIKNPGRKENDLVSFIDFAPTFLELAQIPQDSTEMQPITGTSITDILFDKESNARTKREYVLIGKERHDVGRPDDQGYPIRGIVRDSLLYLYNFEPERWPIGNPETGYLNTDGGATKSYILNTVYSKNDDFNYWYLNFFKRPVVELYNIKNDPECMHNLANNPEYSKKANEIQTIMFDELRKQEDPRVQGNGKVFDDYEYSHTGSANFYNRYMKHDKKLSWGWVNKTDFQDLSNVKRVQDSLKKHSLEYLKNF